MRTSDGLLSVISVLCSLSMSPDGLAESAGPAAQVPGSTIYSEIAAPHSGGKWIATDGELVFSDVAGKKVRSVKALHFLHSRPHGPIADGKHAFTTDDGKHAFVLTFKHILSEETSVRSDTTLESFDSNGRVVWGKKRVLASRAICVGSQGTVTFVESTIDGCNPINDETPFPDCSYYMIAVSPSGRETVRIGPLWAVSWHSLTKNGRYGCAFVDDPVQKGYVYLLFDTQTGQRMVLSRGALPNGGEPVVLDSGRVLIKRLGKIVGTMKMP
jgi:hypothetical protein